MSKNILVSQTGTWDSLSILSHIIVLMYRLTVVGSLEDVISSRTFSVCSKVSSKIFYFFWLPQIFCIYFIFYANLQTNSESTDVCVEDKRCEATLTECADFSWGHIFFFTNFMKHFLKISPVENFLTL